MKTTLVVFALVASLILNLVLTGPRIAAGWRELRVEYSRPLLATTAIRPAFHALSTRTRFAAETPFRRVSSAPMTGVPTFEQPETPPRRPQPLQVTIELTDSSRVIGVPDANSLTLQTDMGKMNVQLAKVASLKLKTDRESVLVEMLNADKVTGFVEGSSLPVTTLLGKVSVPLRNVREMRFTTPPTPAEPVAIYRGDLRATLAAPQAPVSPENWQLLVRAPALEPNVYRLRPYDDWRISVAGPNLGDAHWSVSPQTSIDDRPLNDDARLLEIQGYGCGPSRTDEHRPYVNGGISVCRAYLPYYSYPSALGKHSVALVLATDHDTFTAEPFTMLLDVTESERRELSAFEESGASAFLKDRFGFRRPKDIEVQPMPYAAVLAFVKEYPASWLTQVIQQHVELIWLYDVNSHGICRDDDRRSLGEILAAIDQPKYQDKFQNFIGHMPNKNGPDISGLWLQAVTQDRRAQRTD